MAMPIFTYGKIKPLRQSKGLNQSEIAAELGISRPTYVLMEQGEKEPTLTQLYTLARLLGVEAGELCANLPAPGTAVTDYPKFKELVATCIQQSPDGSTTKTKLSLLTYLIDFAWHYQTSRPMTGETYRYTSKGPVADNYFRALDGLYEAQAIALDPEGTAMVIRSVEKRLPKLFNEKELGLINLVCSKWKDESTEAITNFVRKRIDSKAPILGDPIPYESILGEPAASIY